MKKHYIISGLLILLTSLVSAQITQVTDLNATGDAGIANPFVYNGEVYFEADAGDEAADELYKIAADGSVVLVKNINVDPDDTTPNSDPGNFIEYKGKLYFKANDGDKTGHDIELWATDGTEANTQMVADIWAVAEKGSNPSNMFVFNDKLYFQANDGTSTEWWSYDAVTEPVKATTLRASGFSTVNYAIVDAANNRTFFQYNNDNNKMSLCILKADGTTEPIVINETDHSYIGSQSILFNGKLVFQGDNGTDGDELWISDGTQAGTSMLLDINTVAGANSDPESFTIVGEKLYFVADAGTGAQLWETNGTTVGTKMVAETIAGGDGELDNLVAYKGNLLFSATDGTNGTELWMFDGSTATMLKDINEIGDADPEGFTEVDGLLFFEAEDSVGVKLWVSDGTAERTMSVAQALNTSFDPLEVNSSEFAVVGSLLYYTADDAQGDEFFVVDAKKIFSGSLMFKITDGENALEGVEFTFDGITKTSGADGMLAFEDVRFGVEKDYTATKDAYEQTSGKITIDATGTTEEVVMTLIPKYTVTFTVNDGTAVLEGAEVVFNGVTLTTNASGQVSFSDLLAANDMAYSVSLTAYESADGIINVVDADVEKTVSLTRIVYSVTFNVSDGAVAQEGASVTFNGNTLQTDASGKVTFADVVPGTGLEYSVSLDNYLVKTETIDVDGDESIDVVLVTNGLQELDGNTLSVYPNPSNGVIFVKGVSSAAMYRVIDVNGKQIASGSLVNNTIRLDVAKGLYFLQLNAEGVNYIEKVVIK